MFNLMESQTRGPNFDQFKQTIRKRIEKQFSPLNSHSGEFSSTDPSNLDVSEIKTTLEELSRSAALTGQLPPVPSTFRGRMGIKLVRLVQRMLFWYTPQIQAFQRAVARMFRLQTTALEQAVRLGKDSQSAAEELARLGSAVERIEADHTSIRKDIVAAQSVLKAIAASVEDLNQRLNVHAHNDIQTAIAELREELASQSGAAADKLNRLGEATFRIKSLATAQDRRISLMIEELRKRLPEPLDQVQVTTLAEEIERMDAFYAALEDRFRGTRDEIKKRQKVYVPLLTSKNVGTEKMPVLDIGCGRGEWLELLRDSNLVSSGIDKNRVMIAECVERGLQVREADALEYLRSRSSESLGAVTAFHVIEHLKLEDLLGLLRETVRVLKPGGLALFETPSPENVLVGSCNFYIDPTHRNPIPSGLASFLLEEHGLCNIEIRRMHPFPDTFCVPETGPLASRFNEYFHSGQDYCVIGYKV